MITDPRDPALVYGEAGGPLLRQFNRAGVLAPADVHTALRLGRIGGETDEEVLLAVALAVRAPRVGNVAADLASLEEVAVAGPEEEAGVSQLPWPSAEGWIERVAASPLIGDAGGGDRAGDHRPLQLAGTHLYLDRYWRDELAVAADVRSRIAGPTPGPVDEIGLEAGLARLLGGDRAADQRRAAEAAIRGRFTVIAGGPGTGKTTTVARILALLFDQPAARPPLVALAAPTGKAAARLEEAVRAEAAAMDMTPGARRWLTSARGSTVHRLLGSRPGRSGSFRHDRYHRLPHDVVVVDEASMMSLALMARLLEAVRPDARLVLVGDPEQLVSVEAGAVLADIVGPTLVPPAGDRGFSPPIASRIVRLTTNHRFSGALADLAASVRVGDADTALEVLAGSDPAVSWIQGTAAAGEALRGEIVVWASRVVAAARQGETGAALDALRLNRVLCAHRDGPAGASTWNERVEAWIGQEWPGLDSEGQWYSGRAVLITANDYGLQLFNGDTGVAVAGPDSTVTVAFTGPDGQPRLVGPSRLAAVDTVFAMTVHKSQGSEFDQVTLILPGPESRLLTRELLYTALTRARRRVVVVGEEEAVRAAVERPVGRASGLAARLWAA